MQYEIVNSFGIILHKSETLEGAKRWKNKFECKDSKVRERLPEKVWKIREKEVKPE